MKSPSESPRHALPLLFLAAITLVLAGCATHKIDWAARVGHYNYDQAVMEFGPPDKMAKLDSGITVAEWMIRSGYTQAYATPGLYTGYCAPYYMPYSGPVMETSVPGVFLRLIFGSDNVLQSWKSFYK